MVGEIGGLIEFCSMISNNRIVISRNYCGTITMIIVSFEGILFLAIPECPSTDVDGGVCGIVKFYPFMVMITFCGRIHEFIYDK